MTEFLSKISLSSEDYDSFSVERIRLKAKWQAFKKKKKKKRGYQ